MVCADGLLTAEDHLADLLLLEGKEAATRMAARRLARELLGEDLDDPDARFELEIALRAG